MCGYATVRQRIACMLRKMLSLGTALSVFLLTVGCTDPHALAPDPPELGRNLPSGFAEADAEFARRVTAAFPLPIPENDLVSQLSRQGFNIHFDKSAATFKTDQFPCNKLWRIGWNASDGLVTNLTAKYGAACL